MRVSTKLLIILNLSGIAGRILAVTAMVCGLSLSAGAGAAGLLTPAGGGPALILSEQHVSVVIENGFAVTEVDQVFSNPHNRDLVARYSFPVPEAAAVGEFTFWIDDQPVHAEVLEKDAARALHQQQQQQGKDSALVEQDKYRTFEVEVSPVRASEEVHIRLVYLQRAPVDHSIGRYIYPLEEGGVDTARDSFWTRNEQVSEAFTFKLRLRSSYPVDALRVTNGQAVIVQLDSGEWELLIDSKVGAGAQTGDGLDDTDVRTRMMTDELSLPAPATQAGSQGSPSITRSSNATYRGIPAHTLDSDIVVYWRLAENLPGAVDLVTYKAAGSEAGTFMLTITPGIDLAPITEGRDWLFVLDTSGSMQGKFTALVDGVQRSLGSLNAADRFKVILFSDQAHSLSRGFLPASVTEVDRTLRQLDALTAGGGTNLFDGLHEAVKSLDGDRTTAIILVTDGVANVGETQMNRFLALMDKVDVRLFTAVMGNSANRPLLEGLTRHSEGFAVNVSNDDDMVGLMMQMTSKVTHEAMHDIRISIDGIRTRELTPDEFSRVYRGEQLVVFGKYSGSGNARLTMDTKISGQPQRYESALVFPAQAVNNPELERLWAFASIEALQDQQAIIGETEDSRQGITDIALDHGLVTDYTSLVVARNEVFEDAGIDRRNASRIERERLARTARANQAVVPARQDAQTPAFSAPRQVTGGGGGSVGHWLLALLAVLALVRMGLGLQDQVNARKRVIDDTDQ